MKAARMHRYGGPEVVVVDEVERPVPGLGEVLVRVVAAAVNPVDWKIREGYMTSTLPIEFPYTFGCDLAGTVEEVGEGVSHFLVGDPVFGYPNLLRCGAFAEYACLKQEELAKSPASVSLEEAAAIPVAVMTAYDGLFTYGKLTAGQRVLILGGAGGVGSAAVQLAKWKGAEVFATASSRNQQWLRELGAIPIDYASQATADHAREVDLILDCVGPETGLAALPSIKWGGAYVTTAYALPDAAQLARYGAIPFLFGIQPSGERLAEIAQIVDEGALRLTVEKVFSLEEAAVALSTSQAGRTRGKLLIRPSSN